MGPFVYAALLIISICSVSCEKENQTKTYTTDPALHQSDTTTRSRLVDAEQYTELTLSFVGDLMAHSPSFMMSDYSEIYAGLGSILLEDSLSFANLETVVDPDREYSTYPCFNVQPDYVRAALEAGIDVFSLANNHSNDFGLESSFKTLNSLELLKDKHHDTNTTENRESVRPYFSGLRSKKAENMQIRSINIDSWRIGFIAVTEILNSYKEAEAVYLVPFWDQKARDSFLELIKKEAPAYDLFIVSYHGGEEYVLETPERIQHYLERIHQAGAHIVWGHHPHVIQPWQLHYDGGELQGLILPSMGNFISGQTWHLGASDAETVRAYTGDTAILQLRVFKNKSNGDIFFEHPQSVWISTWIKQGKTLLALQKDLIQQLPSPWSTFYRTRNKAMQELSKTTVRPTQNNIFQDGVPCTLFP